jgi:hypothetical protein
VCRWHATYFWKFLNDGYKFALDLASIKGLNKKSWVSKVVGISILGISRLLTWESREKMTFGHNPMAKHKKYYKGEGGDFLQVHVMVSFVNLSMPMVRSCTKMFQLCTNQLVV